MGRRWIRELAGGGVCGKEGVVLQGPWKGLPEPGWWLCDFFRAVRLRCRVRELDDGLVCCQESVVLCQQGQGMPTCCWWMCLRRTWSIGKFQPRPNFLSMPWLDVPTSRRTRLNL